MAQEIDPKDKEQVEENKVVAFIDGRDKLSYKLTQKGVDAMGKDSKGKSTSKHQVGEVWTGHPIMVKHFAKNGWVEIIEGSLVEHKMPQADKRLTQA